MNKVYFATPYADAGLCTEGLQALIDECAEAGGGQVRFTAGVYLTATLELKSNVALYLDAGAVIRGADDCKLYRNRYWEVTGESTEGFFTSPMWYDALICAYNQRDIAILGHGLIDGSDCMNPIGEQEFRGPHGVFFYGCEGIALEGVSIVRSGNYSTMFKRCVGARIDGLHIFGGQDALRAFYCRDFEVSNCDFRTGDDCISGSMNRDMWFHDCLLNTPGGNTFLFGCVNLRVQRCKLWSQGEYPATFKTNKRYSNSWTGFAMLHDSGDPGAMVSDNWLLEDVELENIETVFRHDRSLYFEDGDVGRVVIDGIRAVNYIYPITLTGKPGDPMDFTLRNGTFIRRTDDDKPDKAFLRAEHIAALTLENVTVENGDSPVIGVKSTGRVRVSNLRRCRAARPDELALEDVAQAEVAFDLPKTSAERFVHDDVDSIYVPIEQDETFRGPRRWIRP